MTLAYRGHLFDVDASGTLRSEPDGVLAIANGRVVFRGRWAEFARDPAAVEATVVAGEHPRFLLPGFVDTHVHYPQVFSTDAYASGERGDGGSASGQLLDWLERCIFPAETRLADPEHAARAAAAFCARRVAAGTTTALVFGSAFPSAQDALLGESLKVGLRTVSGRGVQTAGPASAAPLLTDIDTAVSLCADEIERWHGAGGGLIAAAVVPRFALSLRPRDMTTLAAFYGSVRDRGVYFHTHLSENDAGPDGEVASTCAAYGVDRYLDAYDGFLGRRSVFAHAVHCHDDELSRLAAAGSAIAHCPTSQFFLGSGTMPWRRTVASGVEVALGTDVGAGDEWLLSRVAADCYKAHISEPGAASVALDPARLLELCTLAGARALDLDSVTGNFDVGKEADVLIIEPHRWPALDGVLTHAPESPESQLFSLLLGLREPAIADVLVRGVSVVG
ncbi:amidohydrolase family protein [Tsukamurella soli]|uniref:Amidohydrolase family protein n=1 Tax=Tsukamurella soli TaxID=644556 RepID=A0ABP8JVW4_9ACTN